MKSVKWLWVLVGIVVVGFVVGGGYGLYENHQEQVQKAQDKLEGKAVAKATLQHLGATWSDSDLTKKPSMSNSDIIVYKRYNGTPDQYVVHVKYADAASVRVNDTSVKATDSYLTYDKKSNSFDGEGDNEDLIRADKSKWLGDKIFESLNYKIERTN
jgi:Nuclear pore complex subunit